MVPKPLEERIRQAENSFMFEISVLEKNYDFNDPQGKTDFFSAAAKKLLEFPQELREIIISKLWPANTALLLRTFRSLSTAMERNRYTYSERYTAVRTSKTDRPPKDDAVLTSQKLLLTWLVKDTALFEKISPYIGPDDFSEPVYHQTARLLFDEYKTRGTVTPARIISLFEDKDDQAKAAQLFNTTIHEEDPSAHEKAVNDTVIRILKHSLDRRSKQVRDLQELQDIIRQKAALQHLHISL